MNIIEDLINIFKNGVDKIVTGEGKKEDDVWDTGQEQDIWSNASDDIWTNN